MSDAPKTGYIYALAGPNGIRYIGRTLRAPGQRYSQHKRKANEARDGRARGWRISWNYVSVYNWWASLEEDPEMVILEEPPAEELEGREQTLLDEYAAAGHPLTNRDPAVVNILGPQIERNAEELDRIILAEIRSGKPNQDKKPPLAGFDD
jgi:hypothetical protein